MHFWKIFLYESGQNKDSSNTLRFSFVSVELKHGHNIKCKRARILLITAPTGLEITGLWN